MVKTMIKTEWEMINKLQIWQKALEGKQFVPDLIKLQFLWNPSVIDCQESSSNAGDFYKRVYNREILRMSEFITDGLNGKLSTNCRSLSNKNN